METRTWRGPQVCSLTGISYRQLDYWARTDVLVPSIADARGSGTPRLYSTADVCAAAIASRLRGWGVELQSIRRTLWELQQTPLPAWPAWVVVTPGGLLVELTDALGTESGDLDVCLLVHVRSIIDDVLARAVELG